MLSQALDHIAKGARNKKVEPALLTLIEILKRFGQGGRKLANDQMPVAHDTRSSQDKEEL